MKEKYSTFWLRFFAGVVDGIILSPLAYLLSLAPISFLAANNIGGTAYLVFTTIVWHASVYTYSVLLHWKYGQTLGKKLCGVRVVDVGETRLLTLEQSFKRDMIPIMISVLGIVLWIFQLITGAMNVGWVAEIILDSVGVIWFLLEIFTMLSNDKRRAFHDYLAGSVVVQDEYWHGPRENV